MLREPEREELWLAKKTAELFAPKLEKYYRAKYVGLENIPDTPFLGVGNHLGVYFMPESFLWAGKYHRLENKPPMKVLVHHMLHRLSSIFKFPEHEFGILDANPRHALRALEEGFAVTVYPGGDRENSKPFKDRNKIEFYNHFGYIELALKAGVPILPIVGVGGGETLFVLSSGEKIAKRTGLTRLFRLHTWPIYWSFPCGWHVGHFPYLSIPLPSQVTLTILPPVDLSAYAPEDANNPDVLKEINDHVIRLMQTEMDKQVKGRIPVIGKIGDRD